MKALKALFRCCVPNKEHNREELECEGINNEGPRSSMKEDNLDILTQYKIDLGDDEDQRETGNSVIKDTADEVTEDKYPSDYYRILFEDRLIRDDEINHITFTKKGLLDFVEHLNNLEDYELIYNQNRLLLHGRKAGSVLNNELCLVKSIYTLPKSEFKGAVTLEYLAKLLYNSEDRLKWDSALKVLKKLEGQEDAYVVRSWMHSPMFMVAEREVVDKRVEFVHEGIYYNISTSAPESYFPEEPNVVRVKTYINALILSCDNDNFYFKNLNQVDFKMPVPQSVINITLPTKVLSWYKQLIEGVNKSLACKAEELA